ncbi:hypothetical protein ABVT39_024647 [Epinephelus coioides]
MEQETSQDKKEGGDHIKALKSFVDKVEQIQPQTGVWAPKNRCGKQELYPESGLFLTSTRLAAIHAEARKDGLCLFHLLFDEFFNAEECQNAVAFGKHEKVSDGKTVLDKSKVVGILNAVLKSFKEGTDNVRRHAAEHLKHATARRARGNINSSSLEPLRQGVLHLPV